MQTVFSMQIIVVTAFLVATVLQFSRSEDLPSYIKVCSRSDPKLNDCVKDSIEKLRSHLAKGMPELGIPSCEPLFIKELHIDQGQGAMAVKSIYTNIKAYGPTKFKIQQIKVDYDNKKVYLKFHLPYLRLSSKYKMNGRILMMPIMGAGYSEGNYTDVSVTAVMHGEHVKKNDVIYYNVKRFDVIFKIGHAQVYLDNLFNGDKKLGLAMNQFLNENWETLANDMKPTLEKKIGEMFKGFANKIYHKYPLDQILPP